MFSIVVSLTDGLYGGLQERKVVIEDISEREAVPVVAVVEKEEEEGWAEQDQTG